MARTLALDVGNRRIGVAVSDVTKLLAKPIGVIDRKAENAPARVLALVREQDADEVIVGLPYHADGRVSEQAMLVRQFVEGLSPALNVPVLYVDERHSTQDAKAIIADQKKRKQPMHDDAIAAAVILQRYLDGRRSDHVDGDFEIGEE
jgi:putative Holliday junction resolvase